MKLISCSLLLGAALFISGKGFAAAPGSFEWHLGYGKDNMSTGHFERAVDKFQDALRLKPDSVEAKNLLEQARTAVKNEQQKIQPRTQADKGTSQGLRKGDAVEFDRFSNDQWGAYGQLLEIKEPSTACPQYRVRSPANEPNGVVHDLMCGRVRAAAKIPPVQGRQLGGALALGDYVCNTGPVGRFQARGTLTLKAGGSYDYVRGGGNYQYEAGTGAIRFTSGYFFNTEGVGKFTPGKKVAQVDINYAGPPSSYWTCGHNMP